jgi:hypothetical protein
MKTQLINCRNFIIFITVLIILTFALHASAQKQIIRGTLLPFAEDTAMFPHDFNDEYYAANGVVADSIFDRRTGKDFLSVFSMSSNPAHRNVRVLVTLPAYNEYGEILFWTPLGELNDKGFTDDAAGNDAREIAAAYPIYVFPKASDPTLANFTNVRQAALIDETQKNINFKENPLGLRMILTVNFTEKAFTKEGISMMQYLEKKNGLSLEGTPLIKSRADIDELFLNELVTIQKRAFWEEPPTDRFYSISPVIRFGKDIASPIAADAFLIMVTRGGQPLASEQIFADTFFYIQKNGVPPYNSVK